MHKRVCNFLEQQNCFHIAQFDFCISFSTNNALMSVTENIQSQLDQKKFWAGVSVDLQKAFDTVDHEIVLKTFLIMVLEEQQMNGFVHICLKERNMLLLEIKYQL